MKVKNEIENEIKNETKEQLRKETKQENKDEIDFEKAYKEKLKELNTIVCVFIEDTTPIESYNYAAKMMSPEEAYIFGLLIGINLEKY